MFFKIVSDVPIPQPSKAKSSRKGMKLKQLRLMESVRRELISRMNRGDSFILPTREVDDYRRTARKIGLKITCQRDGLTDNISRIWRL